MKKTKAKRIKKAAVYANGVAPVVGMGATYSIGSDRYPYTITEVNKTGKTIKARQTNPIIENGKILGYDESYTAGEGTVYTLRHNGYFYAKGCKAAHGSLSIGIRNYYMDPHF